MKARWNVPIAVTIAQGALESSWGRKAPDQVFFGVKGRAPDGKTALLATHEVAGGIRRAERAGFRPYENLAASADDYGRFLATHHRFKEAFRHCDDPDRFIHHVAIGGYASDPDYEAKLKRIMAANGLKDFDRMAGSASCYTDVLSIGAVAVQQSPWKHLVDRQTADNEQNRVATTVAALPASTTTAWPPRGSAAFSRDPVGSETEERTAAAARPIEPRPPRPRP